MLKRSRIFVLMALIATMMFVSACTPATTGSTQSGDSNEPNAVVTATNEYFANMPEDINKIDQVAFIDKVKAGEEMTIIDIRSADAYAEGHVKGALSMPWGPNLAENLNKIPADKPVMIYCVTGQTAGQTVLLLNLAGFETKSVNLGYKLGISKVEGVDAVIETTPNAFDDSVKTVIDPDIQEAIVAYYAGLTDVKDTKYANYKITEDDAKAAMDAKDETITFLDVRKAEDFAKGHIEGAANIPFGKGMETEFDTLPTDKTIIVYCYTGQTAGQTVAGLRLLGYDAVSLNSGAGTAATGTAGWVNKGYPLVTN
ncbi:MULTISPECIES: rhodanese-like domain-containing protein [Acetobacterium]|jgi:rhodanese-related sulfurtransferase|uniref:rhodanese-like domain-containing protein n=1 Tax=Acetobacterium TaxID=33951 RepID=UPI000DBEAB5D|nr:MULTISPECIES: rhodanese-like domain-containing protein [unclassified Acetobacterium]AWW25806.1 sulfurtransferase [Acetobacterium sp. KB-1]MDZ5725854.1 rhodanese-like domain-containing protein [Acetobacterium sp. K1/6]